jgi:hypothetical protein
MQEQVAKRIVTIAGEVLSASLVLMDRLQKPNHLELELLLLCVKSYVKNLVTIDIQSLNVLEAQ